MFKVWSARECAEQKLHLSLLLWIRVLQRKVGCLLGVLVCGVVAFGVSGCSSVCSECPSITFKIDQKLEPCSGKTPREGQGITNTLVLRFKLNRSRKGVATSNKGYAWLINEKKRKLLPIKNERVINNFFCSLDGSDTLSSCPCMSRGENDYTNVDCSKTPNASQVVNGMNLVIAMNRSDFEGGGFRFQVTTATSLEEDKLFVLDIEQVLPMLSKEGGMIPLTNIAQVPWSELEFAVEGYWRQDDANQDKSERISFVKVQKDVIFQAQALDYSLVRDESACSNSNP